MMKNVSTFSANIFGRLTRLPKLRVLFALAILMGFMAGGALLSMRVLSNDPPEQMLPLQVLAREMSMNISRDSSVQTSSGAYVPDKGLVLYTRVGIEDEESMRTWALNHLRIQESQFGHVAADDTLIWIVDYGIDTIRQSVLTVPLGQAADIRAHRYTSLPALQSLATASTPSAAKASENVSPAVEEAPVVLEAEAVVAVAAEADAQTAFVAMNIADTFDADLAQWLPLAGEWSLNDGLYAQSNSEGYDFITMLNSDAVADFSLQTRFRHVDGNLGAGLIYHAPMPDVRSGAKSIDLADQGQFLRWGEYDAGGAYQYVGGVALETPIADTEWHQLLIVAQDGRISIILDDSQVAVIEGQTGIGHVGLLTSQSHVEFDDVTLHFVQAESSTPVMDAALPAKAEEAANLSVVDAVPARVVAAPPAPALAEVAPAAEAGQQPLAILALPLTSFADNFDVEAAANWQVATGDWAAVDGEYRQQADGQEDYLVISPFQGSRYALKVDIGLLDDTLRGGIAFNLVDPAQLANGQIVRFGKDDARLEWGRIDEDGAILIDDQSPLLEIGDAKWRTLQVDVMEGQMTVALDDEIVAEDVPLTSSAGYAGLYADAPALFDNVAMEMRTEE